jgi:hypothetical protein
MNLNCLPAPLVPAEAGTQTSQQLSASRVEDARERAYGPWVPASAGTNGDWFKAVQRRCKPKFIVT